MLEHPTKRTRVPQSPDATPPFTLATPTQNEPQDTQMTDYTPQPTPPGPLKRQENPELANPAEPPSKKSTRSDNPQEAPADHTGITNRSHQQAITHHLVPQRSNNQPHSTKIALGDLASLKKRKPDTLTGTLRTLGSQGSRNHITQFLLNSNTPSTEPTIQPTLSKSAPQPSANAIKNIKNNDSTCALRASGHDTTIDGFLVQQTSYQQPKINRPYLQALMQPQKLRPQQPKPPSPKLSTQPNPANHSYSLLPQLDLSNHMTFNSEITSTWRATDELLFQSNIEGNFKVATWNCNQLTDEKAEYIAWYISTMRIDILFIQDTRLTPAAYKSISYRLKTLLGGETFIASSIKAHTNYTVGGQVVIVNAALKLKIDGLWSDLKD